MRKRILAVDVDLTVVDTLKPWLAWLFNKTGVMLEPSDMSQYDMMPIMRQKCAEMGFINFDPFDYWRGKDIYDNLMPIQHCADNLYGLAAYLGCELVFVSQCVPEHETSKRLFLQRHFSPHSFVSTSSKWTVDYDYIIDDNAKVMAEGLLKRPQAKHIQFEGICHPWACKDNDGRFRLTGWSDDEIEETLEAMGENNNPH